tara:strand:+ start:204 stop:377 length:174 start_codon:yes stop_codon:yes gene_type:complete
VCAPFAKVGSNSQILLQREYAESAKEGGNCMIPLKNVRMYFRRYTERTNYVLVLRAI